MELLLDLLERCEKLDIRGWYRAKEELATLREAGEKMAEQLRDLRGFQEEAEMRGQSSIIVETEYIFNTEDAAALAEWEAANK